MFSEEQLMEAVQEAFPGYTVVQGDAGNHFDMKDFPVRGITLRVKPNAFGMFQFIFPAVNDEPAFTNPSTLDTYFKSALTHVEGSSIAQIASNRMIYVYPKYTTRLESCMRLLRDFVEKIQHAEPILFRQKEPGVKQPDEPQASRHTVATGFLFGIAALIAIGVAAALYNRKD